MKSGGRFTDDFYTDMLQGKEFMNNIAHLKTVPCPSPTKHRPVHKMHPIQEQALKVNPQYPNLVSNKESLANGVAVAPTDMPSIDEWKC
jgi:hypothetical protein